MIFGGDIACPTVELSEHLDTVFINNKNVFEGKNKYFNLEGLVADDITTNTVSPIVFNHSSVISVLNKNRTLGVSLANNHTLDIPQYFNNTQYHLEQNNILFSGAGLSVDEAQKVVELNEVAVVKNCPFALILGVDWIVKRKFNLIVEDGKIVLKSQDSNQPKV